MALVTDFTSIITKSNKEELSEQNLLSRICFETNSLQGSLSEEKVIFLNSDKNLRRNWLTCRKVTIIEPLVLLPDPDQFSVNALMKHNDKIILNCLRVFPKFSVFSMEKFS